MARTVITTLIAGAMLILIYNIGYMQATADLSKTFYEGPEGYCLAENHPGPCKDE